MNFIEARKKEIEKKMEKRREVEDSLKWLALHCSAMSVMEILFELKEIHQAYKIPVWLCDDNGQNVFCSIIDRLTLNAEGGKLSVVESRLLAEMLLWPEIEECNESEPRLSISRVLEKNLCRLVSLTLEKLEVRKGGLYGVSR